MDNDETTNPNAEAPEAEAPEVDTTDEAETLAADDADENADESGEDSEEELDIDGEPLKLPKTVAEKLKARMMMQADYTQKTQALAEQRRAIEAERQAAQWEETTKRELFNEEAQLTNVSQRLNMYSNVNWQALAEESPEQYATAHAEYMQLRDYHDRLSGHVEARKGQLAAAWEQSTAIAVDRALAALNTPDPEIGWDGKFDADKSRKLTDFLVQRGANPEALKAILDPFAIKIINLAMIGDEALRKSNASLKKPTAEAKPVPQVATGKTRTGPSNPDKLSPEEWVKWRESSLAKKRNNFR